MEVLSEEATMQKRWKRVWLPLALIGALALATGAVAVAAGADKGTVEGGESTTKVADKSKVTAKAGFTAEDTASWSAEKKAKWNAMIAEKVAWLEEKCGIAVETTEVVPGVDQIVWTDELKSAVTDLKTASK
jgi:hypothetical protein